jgi:ATP-dependent RNA helicase DeaD
MKIITMPNKADTRPKNKTAKTKTAAATSETRKPKRKDKRAAESAAVTTAATPAPARKKAETKTATKTAPASTEEITTVTSDVAASVKETSASAEPTTEAAAEPGFDQLGLSEPIARAIAALGFEAPTPIQARAIPLLLAGRDMIGQAQTGTGKTAAFALPMIEKIDASRRETQALVLAPTRELAVQVAGGIHDLAKNSGLQVVPVYGGQPIDRQFRALRQGAHIVVGTPGRVLDHLRRGSLSLDTVTFCVLDEADEMLALGFLEDMEAILALLPEQRQLAFFSATMPPRIAALTKRFLRDAEHVSIDAKRRTVESVEQTYYEVPRGKKMEALARVLDMETPGPTIVFCHTRQATNELAESLRLRGYVAEALNGEMSQADRERVLRRFRDGQADLLVATDVAARGLDIDTVTHVINYDIPWDVEQYIHRIGRTGRAGRTGDAITLLEARERRQLKFIERMIGVTLKPARIPTAADISARRRDVFKDSLRDTLEGGEFDGHMATVEELSESYDAAEIAAAALQMLWQSRHSAPTEIAEELAADGEQPESGMTRIFVGLGRQDGLRPGELVAAIAGKSGLSGRSIGTIDILDRSTFVEVPTPEADNVISALRRIKIRGRKAKIDVATPRR